MEFAESPPTQDIIPQLAPLAGSLAWQLVLLMLAGLFILYRMVRGMQLGGARQLVSIMALVMGVAAGWGIGPTLAPALRGGLHLADFVLVPLVSGLIAIMVVILVEILGMIFCGKTEEQKEPGKRRFYAVTGVGLGFVNGVITLLIAVIGINLLGTIANTQIYSQLNALNRSIAAAPPSGPLPDTGTELDGKGGPVTVTKEVGNPLTVFLARVKNSMELGPGRGLVDKVDPVPPEIYRILQKAVKVLSDPDCMQLFLQHPDISRITQHEVVARLAQDEDLARLAQSRDIVGLMRHPKLVAAANDPEVQKEFGTVKLEEVLDYALTAHKDTLSESIRSGEATIGETN
jgi:hypothetical protein